MGSKFNKSQLMAIDASPKQNVFISAGAGSGKTRTLTEKVFRLVTDKGDFIIQPSELLVLTFTNNAAHEMKSRIIARSKKDEPLLAEMMTSAHIQTFDSFSQYLVSKYSSQLGISSHFSIINEDILVAKKTNLINEVFGEYYKDQQKRDLFSKTLRKFNISDDSKTNKVVFDIHTKLSKMMPNDRKDFIEHYDEKFLSPFALTDMLHNYVDSQKRIIISNLLHAHIIDQYDSIIHGDNTNRVCDFFLNPSYFQYDYKNLVFEDTVFTQPVYQLCLDLLNSDDEHFLLKLKDTINNPIFSDVKKVDKEHKSAANFLNQLFQNKKSSLYDATLINPQIDILFNQVLSFKDDIHLLLEIVEEVDRRLTEYKKINNCFTFDDISKLSLSLLTDDKYVEIAEEIRSSFKYIMVDEYQDTNNLQELFLESLLKENKKGEKAHLFCVGDAKQSIYGFRSSNVELFNDRRKKYEGMAPLSIVIDMNLNYRSGKPLLDDINYIFSLYMRDDHGAINYQKTGESLDYDTTTDIYKETYDNFGVYRIQSIGGYSNDFYQGGSKEWEAYAILDDIKRKIESNFLIYDRSINPKDNNGTQLRPCRYSDFAIITRVKSSFKQYQEIFQKYGVPLNSSFPSSLNDTDPLVVIQSLLSLIVWNIENDHPELIKDQKEHDSIDIKHLFMSIARSYVYQYSDQQLFDIVTKNVDEVLKEPLMQKISAFCKENYGNSFESLFINMLDEFDIIRKLYVLGNVDDNISKIESLHALILSQETVGEGLFDFVDLFKTINRFSLDLDVDINFEFDNAVTLTTIHASKGLEYKIVYLPNSYNYKGKESSNDRPDYYFSDKYGIILPYYSLDKECEGYSYNILPWHCENANKDSFDYDEHVRLFYVALTRAENAVYLVGDLANPETMKSEVRRETILGMMGYLPHCEVFNEKLMQEAIKEGIISEHLYDKYLLSTAKLSEIPQKLDKSKIDDINYELYLKLWKECVVDRINNDITNAVNTIKYHLFAYHYYAFFDRIDVEPSLLIRLFSLYKLHADLDNWDDINNYLSSSKDIDSDENDDDQDNFNMLDISKENVEIEFKKFKQALFSPDKFYSSYFGITKSFKDSVTKMTEEDPYLYDKPIYLTNTLLYNLVNVMNPNYKYVTHISFLSPTFKDKCQSFDIYKFLRNEKKKDYVPSFERAPNDSEIIFDKHVHKRASIKTASDSEVSTELLDEGTRFHRYMELAISLGSTDFLSSHMNEKKIIDKVLSNSLIKNAFHASHIYPEYGYYDTENNTTGFIDLFYIKDDEYYIIDYKLKHTENDGYIDQLHTYQKNIQRIFNITDSSKIHLYLLSLIDNKYYEVETL